MDFKEQRQGYNLFEGHDDGVEALEMTNLEDTVVLVGCGDEPVSSFESGSNGFLDEDVNAGFEKLETDSFVSGGWGRDNHRVHFAWKVSAVGEAETLGRNVGCGEFRGIGIYNGDELCMRRFAADADVVGAKLACTSDGDTEARDF